jgi:hypothetical protein
MLSAAASRCPGTGKPIASVSFGAVMATTVLGPPMAPMRTVMAPPTAVLAHPTVMLAHLLSTTPSV